MEGLKMKQFTFQFPINERSTNKRDIRFYFVGNLNVSYGIEGREVKLQWITWGDDECKTQIQDLIKAITPALYEDIITAMYQNAETIEPWANGDDDNWMVTNSDFEE